MRSGDSAGFKSKPALNVRARNGGLAPRDSVAQGSASRAIEPGRVIRCGSGRCSIAGGDRRRVLLRARRGPRGRRDCPPDAGARARGVPFDRMAVVLRSPSSTRRSSRTRSAGRRSRVFRARHRCPIRQAARSWRCSPARPSGCRRGASPNISRWGRCRPSRGPPRRLQSEDTREPGEDEVMPDGNADPRTNRVDAGRRSPR